jgi:hypothetical protein
VRATLAVMKHCCWKKFRWRHVNSAKACALQSLPHTEQTTQATSSATTSKEARRLPMKTAESASGSPPNAPAVLPPQHPLRNGPAGLLLSRDFHQPDRGGIPTEDVLAHMWASEIIR